MDSYFPGTACVIDDIDKKILVVLRDGRTLIGYLRSIDQFANLVLHRTLERIHVGDKYGDLPRGVFVVRGENVVLLGEIDEERENPMSLHRIPVGEIMRLQEMEKRSLEKLEKVKTQILKERGSSYARLDPLQEEFFQCV